MRKKNNLLHVGLFILRVALGISIIFHGIPKLMGGEAAWTAVGSSMAVFGITFAPMFWGLLAALTEIVGGVFFAIGLLFRPAAFMLAGMMFVATATHLHAGDGFLQYGHSLDLLIVFGSFILIGAGKYSLDNRFLPRIA